MFSDPTGLDDPTKLGMLEKHTAGYWFLQIGHLMRPSFRRNPVRSRAPKQRSERHGDEIRRVGKMGFVKYISHFLFKISCCFSQCPKLPFKTN